MAEPRGRKVARRGPGAPALAPNVAELRALAHPLRLRLLELFAERPRTTRQVAELLGEPPTRLYHHVSALERADLLTLVETRPNRGAVEKWYTAVAPRASVFRKQWSAATDAGRPPIALAGAIMSQSQHELVSALMTDGEIAPLLLRLVAVGPRERQAAIRARLDALIAAIAREEPRPGTTAGEGDERWALTITLAPVVGPAAPAPAARTARARRASPRAP